MEYGSRKPIKDEIAALTVADALAQLKLKVDDDDIVKPKLSAALNDGDKIVVTKMRTETRKVNGEKVAHGTVERKDGELYEGEKQVVKPGRDGKRDVVYRLIYRNGDLAERSVVKAEVKREPVDEIVKVGTKKREVATNFAAGNSVWDQLAKCESGGNWAINTGNGYYGGLQFSASTWASVGGSGLPHQHSREEQIKRGKILQQRAGWGQWPQCSSRLGLR